LARKSTLLGLLAGLDNPTSGAVTLFDHDLNRLTEDQRAKTNAPNYAPAKSVLFFNHFTYYLA